MSHHLYRHFDKNGVLLYVGISTCAWTRLARGHRRNAPWFQAIARIDVITFDDRDSARAAEKAAIRDEQPKFNRLGSRDYIYESRPRGRKRINHEETMARFPAGMLDRIDAALREKEKTAAFIREAVERELRRREGLAATQGGAHNGAESGTLQGQI